MANNFWWKEAKIYELYVDKFAGNFKNLTAQLDYFTKLGVNTLHILPHYPSPMQDGGYDVMDYLNVRPELGTLEDFDAFVTEAHERGIRIIVDMVLNHISEHHPWFIEARTNKESLKRDYFLWSETGAELASAWNAPSGFKESNWIRNEPTNDYYYATFYPYQPDLNWDNPEVFDAMMANMDFWADRGVDGFRLDAALALVKRDVEDSLGLPETHDVIKHIRKHLDEKYDGRIALLAEAHQEVHRLKQFFGDGDECHLIYHFPMMEALFLALMFDEPERVEEMSAKSEGIPDNCAWVNFLRNHDEVSLATLPLIRRNTLITLLDPKGEYLFNNARVTSVRLANIFESDPERIREAVRLLYSAPGANVMYYGDEIGMRNLPREYGVVDTRIFVRGPFDWEEAEKQMANPDSLFHSIASIVQSKF
jgi:maltose alpha-D-glucosyltransferase / alpha-amylase